jgi:protein O-GlcNAc transferase
MLSNQLIALLQTGAAHHKAGRVAEAVRLYARVRTAAPQSYEGWYFGGLAALQLERHAEAAQLLERAARLAPRAAEVVANLGVAYVKSGRAADAERQLRHALELQPDNFLAWSNLGYVLQVLNRNDEAIATYRRAVALKPDHLDGWYGLGTACSLAGDFAGALAAHERALALNPRYWQARHGRAMVLIQTHRIREAVTDFAAVLADRPSHHEARSYRLFGLNFLPEFSNEQLHAEHLAYGRALETAPLLAENARRSWAQSREPERRLRVGFLSPDLRRHSVAYFLEPLLAHLDRAQFEVLLYHDHFQDDPVSARLRQYASGWRNFVGQSPDIVEQAIRADAPDILIDLVGHTGMNRLPLFAHRLAPVQATYLGYPNTTGLAAMDYRLTDALADPAGDSDRFYTEKLVRFAPTGWSYAPPEEAPPPVPPPCLAGQPVTFGSFNTLSKLNDFTLGLWRELLAAVPQSRLTLKSLRLDRALWQPRLAQAGIPLERVNLLQPVADVAEHFGCYGQIDLALDPFPYHGTTTTCEALWMGVPVVTLAGDRHASRVGVSLLTAIGHPEWIARNAAEYRAKAVALVTDPARLAALRAGLRDDLRRSPLLDHAGQAARFGAALREMWRQWCAGPASPK